ncbi:MAG: ATP-binding protein, partial [Leptospiraceae bacterium]|nr:ATP-binding protein [Leptospiraceae bacterium]
RQRQMCIRDRNGEDLVREVSQIENPPTIIVLTSVSDVNTVVKLMRHGVYDYMVKPFGVEELISRVEKALEYYELKKLEKIIEKEREIRIQNQLNWNIWKENVLKHSIDKVDGNLIANLNSSLVQGAGIGTIATLIEMIKQSSVLEGENYKVSKEFMDLLFENGEIANLLTMQLGEIDYVINNPLQMKSISISELFKLIEAEIFKLNPLAKLKNQGIKLGQNKILNQSKWLVQICREYFSKAVSELLLNAMKFSVKNSDIYILFELHGESLFLIFLNIPEVQNGVLGIPEAYSRVIFEPFFRICRTVQEDYKTLDFGLGLTLVEKIVNQHGGKIKVENLKNYLDNTQGILVNFRIELPIFKN